MRALAALTVGRVLVGRAERDSFSGSKRAVGILTSGTIGIYRSDQFQVLDVFFVDFGKLLLVVHDLNIPQRSLRWNG
jgi:hypothetical protein